MDFAQQQRIKRRRLEKKREKWQNIRFWLVWIAIVLALVALIIYAQLNH